MVKPASEERLRRALEELDAAGWDGARPSLDKVCERAGVGRATAYRCAAFVEEYKRRSISTGPKPGAGRDEGRPRRQDVVSALRASNAGFANLLQHLSLVNERQREEIERLRAAMGPTSGAGGKVVSLRGHRKARDGSAKGR